MLKIYLKSLPVCIFVLFFCSVHSYAQTDTLRVMAYNVLNFGSYPLCQGANGTYEAYLQTIVQFANPDILSLEKMGSIQTSPSDHNYTAAIGFQDSILQNSLEPVFPGRFSYCTFTNYSASNSESLLFYNQQKLSFIGITCTYSDPSNEDFNTWKLYYKDPNLATTHDTTFLYVTVNHDISGDPTADGAQIGAEMAGITNHFSHLANMINMGDFNLRTSSEPCYQILTAPADTNYRYYDPPFHPDGSVSYPANWDGNPTAFAPYLTTSTRRQGSVPNSCGTSGGAKDWFDHIFLSPWIINNANYISYIPHSFRVVGNDGHRTGISVNDAPANTSAPSAVINALFQMSNKYPVMVDLLVTSNTTGTSLPDPERAPSAVADQTLAGQHVTMVNPVDNNIVIFFSNGLVGQSVSFECVDMLGRILIREQINVDHEMIQIPCSLKHGIYYVRIAGSNNVICKTILTKK
jgi:hypothetical protein